MKVATLLFLLCTICLYSASEGGAPAFTKEPPNSFLAVEGSNITLEWTFNIGDGSFRQLIFGNADTSTMVDKLASDKLPWIAPAYTGRLDVNLTDTYISITFLKVNRTDSTLYTLTISNTNRGKAQSQVEITVEYQPKITVHPETQTKTEGDGDVTLSCDASGSPGPTISWTRSGSPVDTSNSSRIRFSEDRKQLTIVDVNKTDSGEYRCVARNKLGNATSSATLNVQYEPEITVHPQAKTKTEGDNVTLSCNATGNPVPTISWTRNGSPVDTIGNSRIRFSENKNELSITNVSRTDSGEYRCVTNNSLGNDTSNAAKLDIQCKYC
ncbi:hypothetical protein ACROYT_G043696 [Oculina patagonica]